MGRRKRFLVRRHFISDIGVVLRLIVSLVSVHAVKGFARPVRMPVEHLICSTLVLQLNASLHTIVFVSLCALFVWLVVCLFLSLLASLVLYMFWVCACACFFVCLLVRSFVCSFVSLFVHLFACLSVCLFVGLVVYLSPLGFRAPSPKAWPEAFNGRRKGRRTVSTPLNNDSMQRHKEMLLLSVSQGHKPDQ